MLAATLIAGNLTLTTGCATLLRGTSQTVTVHTEPSWGTVRYNGEDVFDGHTVTVQKGFLTPQFVVQDGPFPKDVNMNYNPDWLLLGDCALLFAGVFPGVIALAVDFGTGAWRQLDEEQIVNVPGPTITPAAFRYSPY